jgi:hypothetical protein
MVIFLVNLLQKIFSRNKHFGNIRTKHEMSAPLEWRESFWDKLKRDKLFSPIDLSHKSNFKEIRIKIGKKFIVLAINIFLLSFCFNITKDTYSIIKAEYNIINSSNIDFSKNLPNDFIEDEQNKIQNLARFINKKDTLNVIKTTTELSLFAKWKEYFLKDQKQKFIEDNKNTIKGTILSFMNNLFILYLILKKKIIRQQ